jgi:hypothetical protein
MCVCVSCRCNISGLSQGPTARDYYSPFLLSRSDSPKESALHGDGYSRVHAELSWSVSVLRALGPRKHTLLEGGQ